MLNLSLSFTINFGGFTIISFLLGKKKKKRNSLATCTLEINHGQGCSLTVRPAVLENPSGS